MSAPKNTGLTVKCPTCGREVPYVGLERNPFFPFCSERCNLVDLGKWLEGEHHIEEPLSERLDRGEQAPSENGASP